jgi:hypothetical protein
MNELGKRWSMINVFIDPDLCWWNFRICQVNWKDEENKPDRQYLNRAPSSKVSQDVMPVDLQ